MLSRQFASCMQLCRSFASTVPTIGTAQNNLRKAAERATALKQKASAVLVAAKEKAAEKKMRERERKALQDAKLKEQIAARKAAEDAKPKKPTRVLSLMTAFIRANYQSVKASMPPAEAAVGTNVFKAVVAKFKNASESEKKELAKVVDADKQRYAEQKTQYEASKPVKKLTPYMIFVKDQYAAFKKANPSLKFVEISALVAAAYRKQKPSSS